MGNISHTDISDQWGNYAENKKRFSVNESYDECIGYLCMNSLCSLSGAWLDVSKRSQDGV